MIRSPLIALALLALAACSKTEPTAPAGNAAATASATIAAPGAAVSAPAADTPDASTAPPLQLGDFKLVGVLMGNAVDDEHVVLRDSREFAAKDPIYASVLSIGAHQGLKLSAEWLAPDGVPIAKSEQPVVPTSDLVTTFNISNPNGWPAGDYELRVAINGQLQRTEKFSVR
jgi:hypothetical protein